MYDNAGTNLYALAIPSSTNNNKKKNNSSISSSTDVGVQMIQLDTDTGAILRTVNTWANVSKFITKHTCIIRGTSARLSFRLLLFAHVFVFVFFKMCIVCVCFSCLCVHVVISVSVCLFAYLCVCT